MHVSKGRRAVFFLYLGAMLWLSGSAWAQTWGIEYDPALATLPSAQGFTHVLFDALPDDGLSESNYGVGGGQLTQGDTGGPNTDAANLQYYLLDLSTPGIDLDDDVLVVDLRLQIGVSTLNLAGLFPSAGFGVALYDESSEVVSFYVSDTGVFLRNGPLPSSTIFVAYDTTSAMVDYRLRIDRERASLEANGALLATLDRDEFNNLVGSNQLLFGDFSSDARSSSTLESLKLSRFEPAASEVRNYQTVTVLSATDSTSPKSETASCPAGTVALSGGAETIGADGNVGLYQSRADLADPPTSWTGAAREVIATGASWQLRVDVVCGELPGHERIVSVGGQSTVAHQSATLACPAGKQTIGGGAGLTGALLNQSLHASGKNGFTDWHVRAHDFGAGVSSSSWGIDIDAICSENTRFEEIQQVTIADAGSPKQITANCIGDKVPLGGGARILGDTDDAALRRSRPEDGPPSDPPVGWDAEAQATAAIWSLETELVCGAQADPTVNKHGLLTRHQGEFDANDSFGHSHGTLHNGVGFATGVDGQAFSFDGATEMWVEVPTFEINAFSVSDLYPEADFTISAWIRTTMAPTGDTRRIVELYDFGGMNPLNNTSTWYLALNPDGFARGYVRSASSSISAIADGSTLLNDGSFHHLAATRDIEEGRLNLYVDGVEVDEVTLTGGGSADPLIPGDPANPDPVSIGGHRQNLTTSITNLFDGEIDDVMYWDRALSPEEIANIAGCHVQVMPRTLNLDASRFGSPTGGAEGLCVFLSAGSYDLTLVDPVADPEARFSGWSPGATSLWGTEFAVDPEIDPGFTFGLAVSEPSGPAAFAATTTKDTVLTLTTDQRVWFSLADTPSLDNRGGVSIRVPEPSLPIGMLAGVATLALLRRQRTGRHGLR